MELQPGKRCPKSMFVNNVERPSKKNILLEHHKRLLGHRDIFSRDICHKTFFREDNLKAHMRRHDRRIFITDVCNHVFSHPETLDLHKRNRHGQIGKGIKRKPKTTDGPLIKRRITTYDDPEDSFSIRIIGEQKMPKFNTTSTKYKVTFQDLDIRGIPNILKSFRLLFQSVNRNSTQSSWNLQTSYACQYNVQN
jgi:hypothetical protein